MDLEALLDYGHGLEMSDKQAKGIDEQEKIAKVADIQAVREEKPKLENKKCCRCGENYLHKG